MVRGASKIFLLAPSLYNLLKSFSSDEIQENPRESNKIGKVKWKGAAVTAGRREATGYRGAYRMALPQRREET